MPVNDDLGTRMKEYYENVYRFGLTRRTPVAIRIDGKAFHTFTKGFQRPFDPVFMNAMKDTMKYLCENIQGCKIGYTQSDEITLILTDYDTLTTDAWFGYNLQKMCSVAASMATMAFNKSFERRVSDYCNNIPRNDDESLDHEQFTQWKIYVNAVEKGAMFDARVFNIPKEEVCNLLYWRQLDAIRNSILMVGQHYFSHLELQNKSCKEIQEMLTFGRGIDWSFYPTYCKRGSCCIKSNATTTFAKEDENGNIITGATERPHWEIDNEIPVFRGDDRYYVEKYIYNEGELKDVQPIIIN
jgi:tRNA(His) 5'-end guanylyltransferase